jgi:uncharacterized membrane protein
MEWVLAIALIALWIVALVQGEERKRTAAQHQRRIDELEQLGADQSRDLGMAHRQLLFLTERLKIVEGRLGTYPFPEPEAPRAAAPAAPVVEAQPVVEAPPIAEAPPPAVEAPPPAVEAPPPAVEAPPPIAEPPPPIVQPTPRPPFDWESLVGVRLFSWVAGVALVLSAVFFLRYSVENGWLTPPIRMAVGMIAGIVLLVGCEIWGARYRVTANALDAAGIGTLFATSFASTARWHLIPTSVAFILLILTTATAVLLSLRRDALFIALLGLIGGFATPILLSTGEDRPIGLFGYLLLLDAGLAVVAHKKRWPILMAVSVALTTLYQWGWFTKFVTDNASELPLAAAIFVIFPLLWAIMHWGFRRSDPERRPVYSGILTAGVLLPLLLPLAAAWVPAFGRSYGLLFGYLLVVDLGIVLLDVVRPKDPLLPAAGAMTLLVLAVWLGTSYADHAYPGVLAFLAALVLLFLAPPTLSRLFGRPLSSWTDAAQYTAPVLLFAFPVLAWIEPRTSTPWVLFGVLFALLAVIAAASIARKKGLLHFGAAFFAVAAEASWSEHHLTVERIRAALVLYVVFALLYLGVPAVARRWGRKLEPEGSGSVLLVATLLLLLFLASGSTASASLWGVGLLLAILNAGIFVEARGGRLPWLSMVGVAISWIVIAVLWHGAMTPGLLVPALIVMAVLGLVALGGNAALREPGPAVGQGGLLALAGHGFLLFVAAQPSLGVPPWPLLGALLVLDLGAIAFGLFTRRSAVLVGAMVVSPLIVITWMLAVPARVSAGLSWGQIGILSASALAALALFSVWLAARRGLTTRPSWLAAEIVLCLAQATTALAGGMTSGPSVVFLAVAQSLLLVAILAVGRHTSHHALVLVSLFPVAVGQMLWSVEHFESAQFGQELVLLAGPCALFSLYPVVCGARARASRAPFWVAIVASGPAFLSGYHALSEGHLGRIIGALPLAEACVLAGLLMYLLRWLEPAPPRDRARLSLVAAVALGFVTMAVPLQLDNEWITIAWALESAALGWLYVRLEHRGLVIGSFALAAAVVVRLSLNEAIFAYHPRSATPIVNWYLYTYLVSAITLFLAAWFVAKAKPAASAVLRWVGPLEVAGATLLLFLLLNIEIADYHSTGMEITFKFSSTLAEDLTYTLSWALFALVMLIVGIILRGRAVRIAALLLLTVTSGKCFLHDLWRLGGLYRVASFVGLALCLALVAIVLQKFVLAPAATEKSS